MVTRAQGPKRTHAFPTAVVATIILGLAAIALIAYIVSRGDPDCRLLLPVDLRTGLTIDQTPTSNSIDVTTRTTSKGAQNQMQTSGFLECLTRNKVKVVDKNEANIGPSSLGQVANQWNALDGGFKVYLATATQENILQNFAMGADKGHKHDVMERWCQANAACVVCKPQLPDSNTGAVTVELRANAKVERREMVTNGPAQAASPPVAYEDIAGGKRYLRHCAPDAKV